jgi:hypothetical protein
MPKWPTYANYSNNKEIWSDLGHNGITAATASDRCDAARDDRLQYFNILISYIISCFLATCADISWHTACFSIRPTAGCARPAAAKPLPQPAAENQGLFRKEEPAMQNTSDTSALTPESPPVGAVMVLGGGIAGMQASLDLAASGYYVHLVESSSAIGGLMSQLDKTFPTNDCAM